MDILVWRESLYSLLFKNAANLYTTSILNGHYKLINPASFEINFVSPFFLPLAGWNDWLQQWVGYATWTYSRTFNLTEEDVKNKTVWLKCDGLDTVANVRWEEREGGREGEREERGGGRIVKG